METIARLKNVIQNYAWGSHEAIARLLGQPTPSPQPQAELWMGAHPKAPSQVGINGRLEKLDGFIDAHPDKILGRKSVQTFGPRLPYLFKVLAAAEPLSIQAHPNAQQAAAGFERENKLAIPLDAPERNYRDDRHKPEILCAMTDFWALCGFRPVEQIRSYFEQVRSLGLQRAYRLLPASSHSGDLRLFFEALMTMPMVDKNKAITEMLAIVRTTGKHDPVFKWLNKLNAAYPVGVDKRTDIGIIAPLFLNLIRLTPGEAIFLPAGELHAYLKGVGIELMANSDNVLRGGLTPKHVDLPELTEVLSFKSRTAEPLPKKQLAPDETAFVTPANEFVLSVISLSRDATYTSPEKRGAEILLCTQGEAHLSDLTGRHSFDIAKGHSFLVPAAAGAYRIKGTATLFKAAVLV